MPKNSPAHANEVPLRHGALLVALMLISIAASWTGADYCLPHNSHNDEIVYHSQYTGLRDGDAVPEARRRYGAYPSAWMHVAARWPRENVARGQPSLEAELSASSGDMLFIRRCVGVIAALLVPATWLLARRFVSSGWSIAAAVLACTSVLQFCFSTQARPHAPATVAIVLGVVASIEVVRRGTWTSSLVAGFAAGAATAVLQSGVAVLLPLTAAHALRLRRDGQRAIARFALSSGVLVAMFLLANPGILPKLFAKPFSGGHGGAFLISHGVQLADFRGGGGQAVFRAFAFHDPLLSAIAAAALVAGVVLTLRRQDPYRSVRDEMLVVLAFVGPYLAALVLFERTFYRFALPLLPFAALFAVMGLRLLGRAGVVVCGALIAFQALCVFQIARLHQAGDTARQAARWIQENLDRGAARISISPWLDLPLIREPVALASHGLTYANEVAPWLDHQRAMPATDLARLGWSIVDLPLRGAAQRESMRADPAGFLRGLACDYLVVDVFDFGGRPLMSIVRDAARAEGRLVARFTPYGPDATHVRHIEPYVSSEIFEGDRFVWQIWGASAVGECIEVYAFDR
jgi:hypothetical protein